MHVRKVPTTGTRRATCILHGNMEHYDQNARVIIWSISRLCVGDEIHALMECKSDELKNIRSAYLPKIKTLLPDLESMTETQQFYCLMKCANMLIVPLVAKWVDLCNNKFKI